MPVVIRHPLPWLVASLICLRIPAAAGQSSGAHPFGADDLSKLREAHAVAVAPDGASILYDVMYFDHTGPAKHEWHLIAYSGAPDRKLELPEHFTPSGFTSDGTALYGTLPVAEHPQLAIVPLEPSGGATRIVSLPSGVQRAAIAPDGRHYALLADPAPRDSLAAVRTVVENTQTELYVVDATGADGGWWCPALDQITEIAWSPDGSRVAVITQTPKIGHHDVRAAIDVCSRSGARRIAELRAPVSGIAWTEGGKTLAFTSTTTDVLTPDHVWTVAADGGTPIDRTPHLTGSAVGLVGDPAGDVWVEVHKGVSVEIDALRGGQLTDAIRWPGGIIARLPVFPAFTSSPAAMAFTVGDPTHTQNVARPAGSALERITHEGDSLIAHLALGDVRVVSWTAKDGTHLEGIVTFPAGYRAGTRAPFLELPHGGPEANDPLEFDFLSRFAAGLGYVVMQPQYRGSTGYGSDFLDAIYQHFGDRAYSDVNSATDEAIAQGWADPDRRSSGGAPGAS